MLVAALVFAGVAALVNVTPGLDTLLVVRTSVAGGRVRGRAAALGILTGCAVWGVAAVVGLTALLAASHLAYEVLKVAGAGYLAWLGVTTLWRARHPAPAMPEPATPEPAGRFAAFRAGVATNLLNPKAGVFYLSLIPQFLPHDAHLGGTVLFTAIDLVELALWYWIVSRAAAALADRIRRPAFRRRMEQASGVAFLGFAVNLLVEEA
ncbi:LysE family translocator [Actinocatenispora rupis]|uniref:Lysine transporter LysE n=1 Tax=Actinocatenispora rupis TaxID=519421 RepID=A0A8J3JHA9_9ACTN|nr:LysE family translocator [Actinocatenispora rupis]GID16392.1 lysine transporter LysE [Actinocatenispora rupis]